ncbi:hypothetical protein B5X24_HaOG212687 [Helicoverpa armigera]|nr:hypothetical protein B5X24_HaOG212687 [Helicoverpa armigera]
MTTCHVDNMTYAPLRSAPLTDHSPLFIAPLRLAALLSAPLRPAPFSGNTDHFSTLFSAPLRPAPRQWKRGLTGF